MTARSLEDSFLDASDSGGSLEQLVMVARPAIRKLLEAEEAPSDREVADVLALLLAYCIAIELVLARAAGRSGKLDGHGVGVRGYVEQALSGEARTGSLLRLTNYFKDAIVFFMQTHAGQQKTIDGFARELAEALRASRIEERVHVNPILKMFGLHEGAYWREFRSQLELLDTAALKQLVQDRKQRVHEP